MSVPVINVMCTGNSFRSQMAEAYLRKFAGHKAVIYSSGVKANGKVTEKAKRLMAEENISLEGHSSNQVDEYLNVKFDIVLTVCDNANAKCPTFNNPVEHRLHQSFPDPEKHEGQDPEEFYLSLRPVRDAIKVYCKELIEKYV
jgi:arsenate reductase